MRTVCTVLGCGRKEYGKGYCSLHWQRVRTHGDPHFTARRANGQGSIGNHGYIAIKSNGKEKLAHIRIAERALGKELPARTEVHHVDENKRNNDPSNLVVCPSRTYHKMLHRRTDALRACGNANWRKCQYCQRYDDPQYLYIDPYGHSMHRNCRNAHKRGESMPSDLFMARRIEVYEIVRDQKGRIAKVRLVA